MKLCQNNRFLHSEETINKIKIEPLMGEGTCNHISDMELTSKIQVT